MANITTPSLTSLITSRISTTAVITTTPAVTTTPSLSTTPSTTPSTTIAVTSIPPTSTVIVTPSTTSATPVIVSSTVVVTPTSNGSTLGPTVVTRTSTEPAVTVTPSNTTPVSTASNSATPSILASGSSSDGSSGLSSSARIALAVILPIAAIAILFGLGLFLWRRRKAKKEAEERHKDEMAEYGFNPNNDPSLVPVGAAYIPTGSEADDGYRGWGTTSSNNRKPSTTLGSNGKGPNAMAYSDTTSQPGNYGYQSSPNGHASEHWSGDPLVGGHHEGIDGVSALGGAAVAGGAAAAMASRNNNRLSQPAGVQRGPSNASSTYSHNQAHSETSSDSPGIIGNYYQEEVPYNIYTDVAPAHGPYGEQPYGNAGDQPVIRDVQARRNTRIERVPTFPQTQGGISQNF